MIAIAQKSFSNYLCMNAMKKKRPEIYTSADGGRAVAKLEYTDQFGVPMVEVKIGNTEYRFIVDTGASILCITDRAAAAEDLNVRQSRYRFKNLQGRLRTTYIKSLTLGNIVMQQQAVVLGTDNTIFRTLGIDGIVGGTILEHFIVSFNSQQHTLTLTTDHADLGEQPATWESFKLWRNLPLLRIGLHDGSGTERTTSALFDSGNGTGAVVIPNIRAFEKFIATGAVTDIGEGKGVTSRMIGGLGAPSKLYRGLFTGLSLGGNTLAGIPVMSGGLAYPLLCWRLSEMGIITLDYPHRQYAFTPYTDARAWTMTPYPVMTAVEKKRLVVASVWDPQLRQIISPGDVVESIGGKPVSDPSDTATPNIDELIPRFATSENQTVVLRNISGVRHILPTSLFLP